MLLYHPTLVSRYNARDNNDAILMIMTNNDIDTTTVMMMSLSSL